MTLYPRCTQKNVVYIPQIVLGAISMIAACPASAAIITHKMQMEDFAEDILGVLHYDKCTTHNIQQSAKLKLAAVS